MVSRFFHLWDNFSTSIALSVESYSRFCSSICWAYFDLLLVISGISYVFVSVVLKSLPVCPV
jgi:hypothetical protein